MCKTYLQNEDGTVEEVNTSLELNMLQSQFVKFFMAVWDRGVIAHALFRLIIGQEAWAMFCTLTRQSNAPVSWLKHW